MSRLSILIVISSSGCYASGNKTRVYRGFVHKNEDHRCSPFLHSILEFSLNRRNSHKSYLTRFYDSELYCRFDQFAVRKDDEKNYNASKSLKKNGGGESKKTFLFGQTNKSMTCMKVTIL